MATNWTDETIETGPAQATPVRVYRSGDVGSGPMPLVLHLHGGAFIDGSLDTGRVIPALLAEAGATVVSVDYPHAPQVSFPAGAANRIQRAQVAAQEPRQMEQ